MATRFDQVLGSRRAVAIVIAVAMALAATSIAIGALTDDHAFRAALHAQGGRAPAAYDLFRFVPGDVAGNQLRIRFGHLPWWAAPDLKIHFLRPLTSLVFAGEDAAFDGAPLAGHLISLGFLLAVLLAAAAGFRRGLPPAAATLALAVFGLSAAHVEAYAWISARHVVIAGAFAATALALRPTRHGRWLGPLVIAVGLTASEATLAVVPLWVAAELATPRSWRARLRACVPVVAIGVAYLVAYGALGVGTRGSGGYHDPAADPLGFLALAAIRVPLLLGDAALGIPAELAHLVAEWQLALAGVLAVGLVALGVRWTAPRRNDSPRDATNRTAGDNRTANATNRTADNRTAGDNRTANATNRTADNRTADDNCTADATNRTADATNCTADDNRTADDNCTADDNRTADDSRTANAINPANGAADAAEPNGAAGAADAADATTRARAAAAADDATARPAAVASDGAPAGRALAWLATGGVAATVLGAAGYPAGRMLVIPDLAFAPILGLVMWRGLAARGAGRVVAVVLAIVHLGLAPLGVLHTIRKLVGRAHATEAIAARAAELAPPSGRLYLLAASDPMVFLYPRGILADERPGVVRCWSVLSAARAGHRFTRTGAKRFVLEPIERPLLDGSFDQLFRAPDRPFSVGDTVEQCGAVIRVAAVERGLPSRLEVELQRKLEDPVLGWVVWRDHRLERFVPPPIGQTVELPWSSGPSGVL